MSDEDRNTESIERAMQAATIEDTSARADDANDGYFINIVEDDNDLDQMIGGTSQNRDNDAFIAGNFADRLDTSSVIVTDIPVSLFDSPELKETFEYLFTFDNSVTATFTYFKVFRRCRVDYATTEYALRARNNLSCVELVENCESHTYLLKPIARPQQIYGFLEPPDPDRVFLISPPASPPVGWEQVTEQSPTLNKELLEALAKLESSGADSCELLAGTAQTPGIVVHTCSTTNNEAMHGCGMTDISLNKNHTHAMRK